MGETILHWNALGASGAKWTSAHIGRLQRLGVCHYRKSIDAKTPKQIRQNFCAAATAKPNGRMGEIEPPVSEW